MRFPKAIPGICVALLVMVSCLSCSPLEDETWMRITSFREHTSTESISFLTSDLSTTTGDLVDIVVANATGTRAGFSSTGVTIYQVSVSYASNVTLPSYSYGVSTYIAAGTGDATASTEGTVSGLPLVTTAMKDTLEHYTASALSVQAQITLRGRTDEGRELETSGSLPITFTSGTDGTDETVTTPDTPTAGVTFAPVSQAIYFSTGGASSSKGHALEYRFDWGDGSASGWSSSVSTYHAYSQAGSFVVRSQARCAEHTDVISSFSDGVTVVVGEQIATAPTTPIGSVDISHSISYSYSTAAVSSNLGHALEYVFYWGDGASTVSQSLSASHAWSGEGDYNVTVQARCQSHPAIVSPMSGILSVHVNP